MKPRGFQTVGVVIGLVAVGVVGYQAGKRTQGVAPAVKTEKSREAVDDEGVREIIDLWLSLVRKGKTEAKGCFARDSKPSVHIPDLEGVQDWTISDIYTRYRPEDLEGNDCDAFATARVSVVCKDKALDHRYTKTLRVHLLKWISTWVLATTEELD